MPATKGTPKSAKKVKKVEQPEEEQVAPVTVATPKSAKKAAKQPPKEEEVEVAAADEGDAQDKTAKKKRRRSKGKKDVNVESVSEIETAEEAPQEAPIDKKKKKADDTQEKPKKKKAKTTKEEPQEEEEAENEGEVEGEEGEKFETTPAAAPVDDRFEVLPLDDRTKKGLEKLKFTRMTPIQSRSIPPLLAGKDLLGAAKTGSGKTLAFLVPAVELLCKAKFRPHNGTGVLILSPTRELALQIYGVLRGLMEFHSQTHCVIMGGTDREAEAEKLERGCNIVVATPGRLIDHLQNTPNFVVKNLKCLVIDEADRILQVGFEDELREIVKLLPKDRQTMLFSATQTQKVEDLVRVCFKKTAPVYVGVDDGRINATVDTLEQGYVICPSEKRFNLLFTFLKKNMKKKVIVFFSSCNSVKYHAELLNYIDIPVLELHGNIKQQRRTTTFFEFMNSTSGILLCTDVAARGLDIPAVDWIVQYDPPDDPKEYIHRVGRTARAGTTGRALLFLLPTEIPFLRYLKAAKVPLHEYEFPDSKIANIQERLEALVEKNYYLYKSAREAYRSYLLAYASHSMKDTFVVGKLDLQSVAKGLGFMNPPKVNFSFSNGKEKVHHNKQVSAGDVHSKKGAGKNFSQVRATTYMSEEQ